METRLGDKLLITLIVILSMFGPISTDMFLPALDEMMRYFGTVESVMNMALYVFVFFLAFSILILGTISDKYGRRLVLCCSLTLYIVMSVLCCLTKDVSLFIAFRAMQAIGGGGALASSMAIVKDCFEGERMKSVINIMVILGVLGPIVSPVLGGILYDAINWQSTFLAPAAIAGFCLVLALMLPKEIPVDRYEGTVIGSLSNLTKILKNRCFSIFLIMVCVFSAVQLAYVSVSAYVYKGEFGLTPMQYSLVMAAGPVIAISFDYVIRHVLQKHIGNKGIVVLILLLSMTTCALTFLIGRNGWIELTVAMIPACVVMVLSRTFGFNILVREFDGDNGAVSSVINFTIYMFICAGMILATLPWPNHVYAISGVSAMCCVIFIVMTILFKVKGCKLRAL